MRVWAGDEVVIRVRNPANTPGSCIAYVELLEDPAAKPVPLFYESAVAPGLNDVLRIPLANGELLGVAVNARVGPLGAAAVRVWVYLRRRGAAGRDVLLLLTAGHTNSGDWVSWTTSGIVHIEHTPTKHAVNPFQVNPVTLQWDVPTGCAARVTGFTLNAAVAAGTEQSVIVCEYIFAGLVVAASQSTQPLTRPSSPTIRGSIAPLSFPSSPQYVVVPLPSSYVTENATIRVRIDNPNPGDSLTGNAFGVELIAVG
jgi:hypothetical protein